MERESNMTVLDYIIIVLIFISTFFYFFNKYDKQRTYLYVQTDKRTNTYAMDIDKKITNIGPLGEFVINISNNQATINFLSGQKKISIQQESINEMSHSIICISNLLKVKIISSNKNILDNFSIQRI